jgi:hypothetical protein
MQRPGPQFGQRPQQGFGQPQRQQFAPPQRQQPMQPQRPQQPERDPNDFLMGGSIPSASFLHIGDSILGTIVEPPFMQQQRDMVSGELKWWENGDPMEHMVVTLQTDLRDPQIDDDDGRRRLYIKFNMRNAVREAVKKAGAKGLGVGGKLQVTFTSEGEPTARGLNPPKFYEAQYEPPANNFLNREQEGPQRGQQGNGQQGYNPGYNSTYQEVYNAFKQRVADYCQQVPADQTYADPRTEGDVFRKLMGSMFPSRAPSSITGAEWGTAKQAITENFLPDQQDFDFNLQQQPSQQQMFVNAQDQQFKDDDIPF